ncbi:MAG: D-Ala-D-Ala carboxypeptidase family metallohydrolase [Hyphomonas sp.]
MRAHADDCVSDFDGRLALAISRELACGAAGGSVPANTGTRRSSTLEALRAEVGRPLVITSGHRCAVWNTYVGGARFSFHRSIAADIALAGHDRHALLTAAERQGFTGLGLATNFLHLDRRVKPARWFYKGSEPSWQTS